MRNLISSLLFFVSVIVGIIALYFFIRWFITLFTHNHEKKYGKKTWIYAIAGIVILFASAFTAEETPADKADDRRESISESKSSSSSKAKSASKSESVSKANSISESKAKVKSSSIAESKSESSSEKKTESSARKKNLATNLKDFNSALDDLPTKTHGAITKTDLNTSGLTLTLSSDADDLVGDELESTVKSAWNLGNNLFDKYSPLPSDYDGGFVQVEDSHGHELGRTSLVSGSFKYEGN